MSDQSQDFGWELIVDLDTIPEIVESAATPDLDLLSAAIQQAAEYVRDVWARAVTGLMLPGMTKAIYNDDYYESLHTSDALSMNTPLSATIISLYPNAQRIEDGYPSFDMKPGLLNGPSSKVGANGRYNVVPFRHMSPNKSGTGAQGDRRAHGSVMPAAVYRTVKKQGYYNDPASAARGAQQGQRSKLPAVVNLQATSRNIEAVMKKPYTWKYGLYHNMRQVTKQYGKRMQSTYWTYRAVSENSDPDSWIHPGQAANPIIDSVISATETIVADMISRGALDAWGIS